MDFLHRTFQTTTIFLLASFFVDAASYAQTIYGATGWPFEKLWTVDISGCSCGLTEIGPLQTSTGELIYPEGGLAICPDGTMYLHSQGDLYSVDPATGFCSIIPGLPTLPSDQHFGGLACAGGGILYGAVEGWSGINLLFEYDLNAGTVTELGIMPYFGHFGMFFHNDDLYMLAPEGLVLVDTITPANSMLVLSIPPSYGQSGGTLYGSCNALIILNGINNTFALVSLNDGSIVELCSSNPYFWMAMTTPSQFLPAGPCTLLLDLDCDDSSGADENDFNAPIFSCHTAEGVPIADEDVVVFSDVAIDQMTVSISNVFMPDGSDEVLDVNMPTPNIDIVGIGTSTLVLTNDNGTATFNDFIDAIHAIVYINTLPQPTPGIRTVEVSYTNISGNASEMASAFIPVEVLPLIPVNLGPDLTLCDGESTTLNAGNPGNSYVWSTQETTQSIIVNASDSYSVTVSNGIDCPNADTLNVVFLPVIEVGLTGDDFICDNEIANLTILLNTTVPVNITIENSTGGAPITFNDLTGDFSFTDPISSFTAYLITNIVPSSPACIQINDSSHSIEIFPTYNISIDTSICEGDSVWLGTYWQTNPGTYGATYESIHGCDSIVTTHIDVLPEVMVFITHDTCDAAAAGVFFTYLENHSGCDTIVQTTITVLPVDTTHVELTTCISSSAGIAIDTFTNPSGCDSLLITTTTYTPPSDTTYLIAMTCDSLLIGTTFDTLLSTLGCDSIIALTISHYPIDTTYTNGHSCIPGEIGVYAYVYPDALGCDSIVISTIVAGTTDTTLLFGTSCDPASIGVFETILLSSKGCDSLIISTITYSAQDSTFITSYTCDPASAGVYVSAFTNQIGCDSIVTETVSLNMSHQIAATSASCFPMDTGVFIQNLTNQFGCDSMVTETITLLPSDQTMITSTTCIPNQAGTFMTNHFNQYGCDSIVTQIITLVVADTTRLNFYTCDINEVGQIENMFIDSDGCDSLVIETTSLFLLPTLTVESGIDYNGYDISCAGESDGSAVASVIGVPPYGYLWSTNDTDPMITGLSAGSYEVSITDGNGCINSGAVMLFEPDVFMIGFEISEPGCFDEGLGSITVHPSGGVSPYRYSIDGTHYELSPIFEGLGEGVYQLTTLDANDCSATEIISIDVPIMVQVELGDNQMIQLGDSAQLNAIINLPFDSITSMIWNGIDSSECPNCLTQIVAPIITTAYSLSVTSVDGCSDRDSVLVSVTTEQQMYIPNIFSPNGDGINDLLTISTGDGIKQITAFSIFDRWGNLVFHKEQTLPTDPSLSWDGKMNNQFLNPGVYTYKIIVDYVEGNSDVRYGNITLLR